jgi:hypothetical protein
MDTLQTAGAVASIFSLLLALGGLMWPVWRDKRNKQKRPLHK